MITGHVAPGATIDTDGHAGHGDLSYQHETECLSAGAYVNGKASTNGIESFWPLLKWACIGRTLVEQAPLLPLCGCTEQRQNTIGLSGELALGQLLRQAVDKRLTYQRSLLEGWGCLAKSVKDTTNPWNSLNLQSTFAKLSFL